MKMAIVGTTLKIIEADNVQFTVIKSWNKMKWDRKTQTLTGTADLELLDKLSSSVKLPPSVDQRRTELRRIQDAVDRERVNPQPVPFIAPPVRLPLYAHQVRGYNMALLTFGWADPREVVSQNG